MRLLREPLVHFLLLGAALFILFRLLPRTSGESKITITQKQIDHLSATFQRARGRSPLPEELDRLIQDYIREEVLYREALALGLDRDDSVIRQRLREKMEFLSDVAAPAEPTEDQLRSYFQSHPETFRLDRRLTFTHIFLNPKRHPNIGRDAVALLARLNRQSSVDLSTIGDPFSGGQHFDAVSPTDIAQQFGEKFAAALSQLPIGQWQGPIESTAGTHLVLLTQRTEGQIPSFQEVRDTVRSEWMHDQRMQANEKYYQSILKHYFIAVEPRTSPKQPATESMR